MRVTRQAPKKTVQPGHLVVGDKSFPLENIQVDIVTDNAPLPRKFPSNVKITPVSSEEPKKTRQSRVSLPNYKVPPKTIISRTNIPSKSPTVRSSPVSKLPPPPVTRKSSVLNKPSWTATKTPVSPPASRTSSLANKPPGVSSVKRGSDLRRSLPVKRAASPDDCVIIDHVKVSKSVKITPITEPQRRPPPKSTTNLSNKPKNFIGNLTQNKPLNAKNSSMEVKPQTSKPPIIERIPARPRGPPGPPGPPGPSRPAVGPPAASRAEAHICDECGRSFTSRGSLAVHQDTVHVIKCEDCQEKFDTQAELDKHRVTHLEKCFFCEEMFKTSREIENHLEAQHEKKCTAVGCENKFYTGEALDDHIKEYHHFPCSKCSFILQSLEDLTEHTQLLHTFICDYNHCNFVADEQEKLEKHEKLVHQRCEECEDEFTWVDPADHKCFYTSNRVSPYTNRVQVQNLYFKHITYYYI